MQVPLLPAQPDPAERAQYPFSNPALPSQARSLFLPKSVAGRAQTGLNCAR